MTDAGNQFEKNQPKPHDQKLGDREHEAITQKNNYKTEVNNEKITI